MIVDFHGISIEVPDETQAKLLIASRDKKTAEYNDLTTRVDGLASDAQTQKAEANRKAAEAETAERNAQAAEAAKNGDIEKANRILTEKLTSDFESRITSLQGHLKESTLASAIAGNESIAPAARGDAQALIAGSVMLHDGKLVPIGENGEANTTVTLQDHVASFIESRPHLRADHTPASDGSTPPAKAGSTQQITRAEFDAGITKAQTQGLADRTIALVD